ncbi:glycosyltransferase family 4 protein [Gammaproteobacteria bacterium]|nr:glycosyltransferase family 4 protein [Gammaproteobacteria bacterium]
MKKILVLAPYPEGVAAGQRLKYEQYFRFWKNDGYDIKVMSFFDIKTWDILHKNGNFVRKFLGTISGILKRILQFPEILKADIVYIFLWATPIGLPFYEMLLKLFDVKIVYDFDDMIYHKSDLPKLSTFIKGKFKPNYLIKNANHVIISSPFLEEYCKNKNKFSNVSYIPCSLDTKRYYVVNKNLIKDKKINIGWTGTFSSKVYLDTICNMLRELNKEINFKLILITNFDYEIDGIEVEVINWSKEKEITDLHKIDIGIYPISKTEWSLGKGGLKAMQYMACGIPSVCTNFGTVREFIINNENGLLVDTDEDWISSIKMLVNDKNLYKKISLNSRQTIEKKYSLEANHLKYSNIFSKLVKQK